MRLQPALRLTSFLLLILYVLIVVAVILLILQNIFIALVLGATSVMLVYAGWLVVVGTRRDFKKGILIGSVSLILFISEILYLLSDQHNRRAIFIITGLTLVYMLLFGLLRKTYWMSLRRLSESSDKIAKFRKPFLIINPKSGNGRAIKAHIDELAQQQGIQVIMTKKGVDIAQSALEAVRAGADVLGISGGDGSIGAVAKVALAHDLPMVVLPGGTKCHFARDLGLDPKEMADSLASFSGIERRIDAGDINGRIFLNNASFGLYADIIDHPEYREHKMQVSRQVLQEIVAGTKQPYDLQFSHDETSVNSAVQILVGVNRYNTMKVTELGHRDRMDEGVLQITAITQLNNQLLSHLLTTISLSKQPWQQGVAGLDQWVAESFVVDSNTDSIVVGVDGEREEYLSPVRVRIMPGALRIYVPAEGIRSRRKGAFNTSALRKMWDVIRY